MDGHVLVLGRLLFTRTAKFPDVRRLFAARSTHVSFSYTGYIVELRQNHANLSMRFADVNSRT